MGAALVLGEILYLWGKEYRREIMVLVMVITFVMALFCLGKKYIGKDCSKKKLYMTVIVLSICFIGGFLWCGRFVSKFYEVERKLADEEMVNVKGKITAIHEKEYSIYVNLKNVLITTMSGELIKEKEVILVLDKEYKSDYLKIGKLADCICKYDEFSVARNKGNFNEKEYYHSCGISGRFKIVDGAEPVVSGKASAFKNSIHKLKLIFEGKLAKISSKRYFGLFDGILFGEKGDIDENTKELYKLSGILHILAISGQHISLIGICLYKLLRKYLGIIPSGIAAGVIVVSYGFMVGNSISATRAILMYLLKVLADIIGRSYDVFTALMTALLLICIENPLAINSAALHLSFGAIFGIAFVYDNYAKLLNIKSKIVSSFVSSLSVNVVIKPIILSNYYEICNYSTIINVIIVPFMSVVVICGFAGIFVSFVSTSLGKVVIYPACIVLSLYNHICNFFVNLPFSMSISGEISFVRMFIYYMFSLTFILGIRYFLKKTVKTPDYDFWYEKLIKRGCFMGGLLILNIVLFYSPKQNLKITMLDVGQGDCICINTGKNVILTDAGSSSEQDVTKYRIMPFLKASKIKKIDFLIMTHSDEDHINGMKDLIEYKYNGRNYVKNFVVGDIQEDMKDEGYKELVGLAESKGINIIYVKSGDKICFDNVTLDIIWPADCDGLKLDTNQLSVAYYLKTNDFKMLFTGDLGEMSEKELVKIMFGDGYKNADLYKADVLKVGHHGSNSSSSEELLDIVRPKLSLISCGKKNRYGHPGKEVLERLNDVGSDIFITMNYGQIDVIVGKDGFEVVGYVDF